VQGTIAGRPNADLTLDFYAYAPLSIVPEADIYIGSLTVRLDSGGFGSYAHIFPATAPKGWKLTSTVTNSIEGTSELSAPVTIAASAGRRYTLQRLLTPPSGSDWTPVTSTYASISGQLTLRDPILRTSAIYRVLIGEE